MTVLRKINAEAQKSHGRVTAYIHLEHIRQNFESMKANINPNSRMIAVVKTDGYGHGAVPIAKMIEPEAYIWGFAVAAVSEAMALRENGIRKPILILGYTFEEDYDWMIRHEVRPVLFTVEMAEQFSAAAVRCGKEAWFHTAVDTGMSRIGFPDTWESIEEIRKIAKLPKLRLEGIFTHFAKADETDKTSANIQSGRFLNFCETLKKKLPEGLLCHCANSAAIIDLPDTHMDLVRAGISIYGIYPSEEVKKELVPLAPAMEIKSHVVYVKRIEPGTSVSYGGTFTAEKTMEIATIPVGYGDGYPRSLSNCGYVLIHGKKAPIKGRVCMDQFMVDVTGMHVSVLDEVTLLGKDGEEEITVDELGKLSGRFPYEFVCDIGKRVPRVYINQKES
ncbi:MAG: alanine racemase [Lachnospiraceae bacterium]|nr:alanine racemase [Lachnospiraceae bacterium]